jgi:hypothetical protein
MAVVRSNERMAFCEELFVPFSTRRAFTQLFDTALLAFPLSLSELARRKASWGIKALPLMGAAALTFGRMGGAVTSPGAAS